MALPGSLGRRLAGGIVFGMLVYVGMLVWADVHGVSDALSQVPLWVLPAACGLSFLNYCIRFVKWRRYLQLLSIDLQPQASVLIYFAGLSMSVTPGKMGEVFKSWLIRRVQGTPIHTSAPIIVAERFTDLAGYLILVAIGGIRTLPEYSWMFFLLLALCVLAVVLAGSPAFARAAVVLVARLPLIKGLAGRVDGAFVSTRVLLSPREILFPTLISAVAWSLECTGFWLIANAVVPGSTPFLFAIFAFAFSAVAGAVLIIFPGGLGITEFSLGTLLRSRFSALGMSLGVAQQTAAGIVILARLCTLWFAVLLGFVATALFTRRYGAVEAPQ